MIKKVAALFFVCALPLFGQSNSGELRLKVTDPSHLGVKTTVHILSEGNDYRKTLATTVQGTLDVQHLPYGVYQLEIQQPGFARAVASVVIASPLPTDKTISLELLTVNQSVTVRSVNTLIDPGQAGSVNHIGS